MESTKFNSKQWFFNFRTLRINKYDQTHLVQYDINDDTYVFGQQSYVQLSAILWNINFKL